MAATGGGRVSAAAMERLSRRAREGEGEGERGQRERLLCGTKERGCALSWRAEAARASAGISCHSVAEPDASYSLSRIRQNDARPRNTASHHLHPDVHTGTTCRPPAALYRPPRRPRRSTSLAASPAHSLQPRINFAAAARVDAKASLTG